MSRLIDGLDRLADDTVTHPPLAAGETNSAFWDDSTAATCSGFPVPRGTSD